MHITDQKSYFDQLAREWDNIQNNDINHRVKTIFSTKISRLDGPFLDIGSGTGVLIQQLKDLHESYIIELDISKKMLDVAKKKHKHFNQCSFIQADAHHIPFSGNQFGSIVCFCVFPHLKTPELAAMEFHRVLRPGGNLIILHLMNHDELNTMHAELNKVISGDILPASDKLSQTLKNYGFELQISEETSDLYLILAKKK